MPWSKLSDATVYFKSHGGLHRYCVSTMLWNFCHVEVKFAICILTTKLTNSGMRFMVVLHFLPQMPLFLQYEFSRDDNPSVQSAFDVHSSPLF